MDLELALQAASNRHSPNWCAMLSAWAEARHGLTIPREAPGFTAELRGHIGWLEFIAADTIRIHGVGEVATRILGMDLEGRNLLDLSEPAVRKVRAWRYSQVIDRPCGMHFTYYHERSCGTNVGIEWLVLPLAGDPRAAVIGLFPMHDLRTEPPGAEPGIQMRLGSRAQELTFLDLGFGCPDSLTPPDIPICLEQDSRQA